MPRHKTSWIVIAEAHLPAREIGSDRPGRTEESADSARHADEPRHDPHEERRTAFLRRLAHHLSERAAAHADDELIPFAPPRALGRLRGLLGDDVGKRIRGEAPKDLTNMPLVELPQHLAALC